MKQKKIRFYNFKNLIIILLLLLILTAVIIYSVIPVGAWWHIHGTAELDYTVKIPTSESETVDTDPEPETESNTEPETEPKTEPKTEPETEPETEPKTDSAYSNTDPPGPGPITDGFADDSGSSTEPPAEESTAEIITAKPTAEFTVEPTTKTTIESATESAIENITDSTTSDSAEFPAMIEESPTEPAISEPIILQPETEDLSNDLYEIFETGDVPLEYILLYENDLFSDIYGLKEKENGIYSYIWDNDIVITVNIPLGEFRKLYIDGQLCNNYTVRSGSTIITIKAEYIESLEEGLHTIRVIFDNDVLEIAFDLQKPKSELLKQNPPTGENSIFILIALMAVCGCAVIFIRDRAYKN